MAVPSAEKNQTVASEPPKPWRKSLWVVEKLIVPVFFLSLGASVTYWMQTKKPHLLYSYGEVIQFTGEKDEFGLVLVAVTNDGTKEAEEVRCVIELNECIIEDVKAGPKGLNPSTEIKRDGHEAHITIATLNPAEQLSLMIKASKPDQIEKSLDVSVRGKGINGEYGNITRREWMPISVIIFFIFIGGLSLLGLLGVLALLIEGVRKGFESRRERNNPKKVFRFETGEKSGRTLMGQEAIDAYNKLPKPIANVALDNVPYTLAKKTLLNDGTIEFLFLDDVKTRYFNQKSS